MLVYHDDPKSPNCLKTKMLLEELGLEYRQIDHDYTKGELREPAFLGKFPNARVPAIEDGDLCISESSAIALYLASERGSLVPRDRVGRARMYQALGLEAALLGPTIGGQGLFGELGKPPEQQSRARIEALTVEAGRVGQVLDVVLRQAGEYFAGEFSIADIQLFPGLCKAVRYEILRSPALAAWVERIGARPAVRRAMQHYPAYAGDEAGERT